MVSFLVVEISQHPVTLHFEYKLLIFGDNNKFKILQMYTCTYM